MKRNKQKSNWMVDAVLLVGFLIAFMLDLTGLTFHQWLGVAVGMLLAYHLYVHWTWVNSVSKRLLGRTSRQANLYFMVDKGLYLGFLLISLSGLVISTWLSYILGNFQAWKAFHIIVSFLTLLLVVVKVVIHSHWIVSVARSYIFIPESSRRVTCSIPLASSKPASVVPAYARAAVDRGDFLKLMGVVCVGALLAGFSALEGLIESVGNEANPNQGYFASGSSAQEEAQVESLWGASSGSCTVRCDRRCSYPGHCRRYTDSNQNDLCDFGECV